MNIEGRARVFGDDVNTDYIISSARKRATIDARQLSRYLMEGIDPWFAVSVKPDDILVAGKNFGCGSAMEVAATVILAAGFRAVLARSFARSFYRNAINNGLVVVECDTASFAEGDRVSLHLDGAEVRVENVTRGTEVSGVPIPGIMRQILGSGGLVGYLRDKGSFDPPGSVG